MTVTTPNLGIDFTSCLYEPGPHHLTAEEFEALIFHLSSDLIKSVNERMTRRKFSSMCGYFHAFSGYMLQDRGFAPLGISLRTFGDIPEKLDHVATIVEYEGTVYLIDPSLRQFEGRAPHKFLENTKEGQALWDQLREIGAVKITPRLANLYITTFMTDHVSPFAHDKEAYTAFRNPSQDGQNLWRFPRDRIYSSTIRRHNECIEFF